MKRIFEENLLKQATSKPLQIRVRFPLQPLPADFPIFLLLGAQQTTK